MILRGIIFFAEVKNFRFWPKTMDYSQVFQSNFSPHWKMLWSSIPQGERPKERYQYGYHGYGHGCHGTYWPWAPLWDAATHSQRPTKPQWWQTVTTQHYPQSCCMHTSALVWLAAVHTVVVVWVSVGSSCHLAKCSYAYVPVCNVWCQL